MKYERRYTENGHVAHLIQVGRPGMLCGAGSRSTRLGSGSDAEREIADSMDLCKRCAVLRQMADWS